MAYMLHINDILRMQLTPDGMGFRYSWTADIGWIDKGPGGPWADGIVVATTYEPGDFGGWPKEPVALVNFDNADGETLRISLPLPGNRAFVKDLLLLDGYPKPPKASVPDCDCGSNPQRGDTTHYHWCSYKTAMIALKLWDD